MREPYEKLYGKDHFKEQWNLWVDSISSYRKKGDGKEKYHSHCPLMDRLH